MFSVLPVLLLMAFGLGGLLLAALIVGIGVRAIVRNPAGRGRWVGIERGVVAISIGVFGFVWSLGFLASLLSGPGPSEITLDNQTTRDVVVAADDRGQVRFLVPACDRLVFDPIGRNLRSFEVDPSKPSPSGALTLRLDVPQPIEGPVVETITITPQIVQQLLSPAPSLARCDGSSTAP